MGLACGPQQLSWEKKVCQGSHKHRGKFLDGEWFYQIAYYSTGCLCLCLHCDVLFFFSRMSRALKMSVVIFQHLDGMCTNVVCVFESGAKALFVTSEGVPPSLSPPLLPPCPAPPLGGGNRHPLVPDKNTSVSYCTGLQL